MNPAKIVLAGSEGKQFLASVGCDASVNGSANTVDCWLSTQVSRTQWGRCMKMEVNHDHAKSILGSERPHG